MLTARKPHFPTSSGALTLSLPSMYVYILSNFQFFSFSPWNNRFKAPWPNGKALLSGGKDCGYASPQFLSHDSVSDSSQVRVPLVSHTTFWQIYLFCMLCGLCRVVGSLAP